MKNGKWIELIRVRSSADSIKEAIPILENQVAEIKEESNITDAFFMTHKLYEGDFAVAIIWTGESLPKKTQPGLMVADQMERLGSIDHAVWIPTSSFFDESANK